MILLLNGSYCDNSCESNNFLRFWHGSFIPSIQIREMRWRLILSDMFVYLIWMTICEFCINALKIGFEPYLLIKHVEKTPAPNFEKIMKNFIRFTCALPFYQFREMSSDIWSVTYQYIEDVMVEVWCHYVMFWKMWNFCIHGSMVQLIKYEWWSTVTLSNMCSYYQVSVVSAGCGINVNYKIRFFEQS